MVGCKKGSFCAAGMPRTGTTGVATRLDKPRERQLKHPYSGTPVISESSLALTTSVNNILLGVYIHLDDFRC